MAAPRPYTSTPVRDLSGPTAGDSVRCLRLTGGSLVIASGRISRGSGERCSPDVRVCARLA